MLEKRMRLENINVLSHELLVTPEQLKARLPVPEVVRESVQKGREAVQGVVDGSDNRLLVVVGPCSIHDPDAALEYARRLENFAGEVPGLVLIMRAYFEKPRSTVGWKGLINDPYLDDTCAIADGLSIARQLLLDISRLGLPIATEALDPITPQYMQDLISWSAIGARTTESQTHREMASGLSCAVGFKNGTDGSLEVAINALQSARSAHRFLGINTDGQVSVIHTRGNAHAHIVLRGGSNGSNYSAEDVRMAEQSLQNIDAPASIMIDCSHANSNKDHKNQMRVIESVAQQIENNNRSITGVMIESHLHEGSQDIIPGTPPKYGVSVTDACIGWDDTITALLTLQEAVAKYR